MIITLDQLTKNQQGTIIAINDCPLKERLNDIGFVKEAKIKCILISPFGDPKAYLIKGTQIAVRNSDAQNVKVGVDIV